MGKKTRIAITAGDPFGIGPQVSRSAVDRLREGTDPSVAEFTIYGDPASLRGATGIVAVPVTGDAPDAPGPSAAGGRAALDALDRALGDIRAGRQDALVTAPISKESCALAGGAADGHTPLLGDFFGVREPLMAFAWDDDEPVVALLTTHIPLRAVPSTLTSARVEAATRLLHQSLRERWGLDRPRLGVLGLNPHAGENGLMGTEESDFVEPALARMRADGMDVSGPLPGDTAFAVRERFDGLLALYHDQGLAPVKALAFDRAVNITLGLPIVRTSPCHGTAFDLAGSGTASDTSMTAALQWALRLSTRPVTKA